MEAIHQRLTLVSEGDVVSPGANKEIALKPMQEVRPVKHEQPMKKPRFAKAADAGEPGPRLECFEDGFSNARRRNGCSTGVLTAGYRQLPTRQLHKRRQLRVSRLSR